MKHPPADVPGWTPPAKIWNKMFLSIFFANMSMNLGQQMSNSLLSLYAKSLGAPADQIGELMSMFAITALIFRFISGPAMNSFNRKKLVIMAISLMASAYLGFSLSPVIAGILGLETITVLKFFRLLQGIGNAFGNSCCLTIVADVLPKDKFTAGMGYYSVAQVVSQAVGPSVGVFLRDIFGFSTTYILFFGIMLLAVGASTLVKIAPRPSVPFKVSLNNVFAKEALVPSIVTLLVAMGFNSIGSFLLVYTEERGIAGSSLFFTVYALTMLVTRPVVGNLTNKFGFVRVCIPAVLMTACSLLLIGYAPNLPVLLFAAFVNSFGYGAVRPMLQSLCMKSVPPERRGSASSTNYIFLDAATLMGPTLCGEVAARFGYVPAMWVAMAIPVVLGAFVIFFFRKNINQIEQGFQAAA